MRLACDIFFSNYPIVLISVSLDFPRQCNLLQNLLRQRRIPISPPKGRKTPCFTVIWALIEQTFHDRKIVVSRISFLQRMVKLKLDQNSSQELTGNCSETFQSKHCTQSVVLLQYTALGSHVVGNWGFFSVTEHRSSIHRTMYSDQSLKNCNL